MCSASSARAQRPSIRVSVFMTGAFDFGVFGEEEGKNRRRKRGFVVQIWVLKGAFYFVQFE